MVERTIYRISFLARGEVYEIFARHVSQGGLLGFIEIEELVFGERTKIVVDPSEERLRSELEGVRRTYVPIHSVIRIDEVERVGSGRITASDGKVTSFPMTFLQPEKDA
jgi:hypothetical protein